MPSLSEASLIQMELESGKRTAIGGLCYPALYLMLRFFGVFPGGIPLSFDLCAAAVTIFVLSRAGLYLFIQRKLYPDPRWRRIWKYAFRILSLLVGCGWGVIIALSFLNYGVTAPTFLLILIGIGTTSTAHFAFGLDRNLLLSFFLSMTLPPALTLIFKGGAPEDSALAVGIGVYVAFLSYVRWSSHQILFESIYHREKFQAQGEQLQAVVDAIPGFVAWTDSNGNYLGMNKRLLESWGVRVEEFRGKSVGFTGRNSYNDRFYAFLGSDIEEGLYEEKIQFPNEARWMLIALKKFMVSSGQQIVAVGIDIEDRKRAQQELEAARIASYESVRLATLGIMAGGIAHEINNPLQIIQAHSRRIRRSLDQPKEANAALDRVDETVERIAKITRGLRAIARDGKADPFEKAKVTDIVHDVLLLCDSRLAQQEVKVEIADLPDSWEVECRPSQISQVLINLVNNSVDAISLLPVKWIRVEAQDLGTQIKVSVTDSGAGVSTENRDKIMVPFFTTKKVGAGMGLGLSISRSILEDHQGTLFLDEGAAHTCFTLVLPKERISSPV